MRGLELVDGYGLERDVIDEECGTPGVPDVGISKRWVLTELNALMIVYIPEAYLYLSVLESSICNQRGPSFFPHPSWILW